MKLLKPLLLVLLLAACGKPRYIEKYKYQVSAYPNAGDFYCNSYKLKKDTVILYDVACGGISVPEEHHSDTVRIMGKLQSLSINNNKYYKPTN